MDRNKIVNYPRKVRKVYSVDEETTIKWLETIDQLNHIMTKQTAEIRTILFTGLVVRLMGCRHELKKSALDPQALPNSSRKIHDTIISVLDDPNHKERVFQLIHHPVSKRTITFFLVHYLRYHPVKYYLSPNKTIEWTSDVIDSTFECIDLYKRYKQDNPGHPYQRGLMVNYKGLTYAIDQLKFYIWAEKVALLAVMDYLNEDIQAEKKKHYGFIKQRESICVIKVKPPTVPRLPTTRQSKQKIEKKSLTTAAATDESGQPISRKRKAKSVKSPSDPPLKRQKRTPQPKKPKAPKKLKTPNPSNEPTIKIRRTRRKKTPVEAPGDLQGKPTVKATVINKKVGRRSKRDKLFTCHVSTVPKVPFIGILSHATLFLEDPPILPASDAAPVLTESESTAASALQDLFGEWDPNLFD